MSVICARIDGANVRVELVDLFLFLIWRAFDTILNWTPT